jgi:hypothetical protein
VRFTDETIVPAQRQPRRNPVQDMIRELESQPGRWAEVATYPPERMQSARSRGSQTCKRYPQLQYAVTPRAKGAGYEYVLYFRTPTTEEN